MVTKRPTVGQSLVGQSLVVMILAMVVLVSAGMAQGRRPLTADEIVGLNRASETQIAIDGRRITFVLTTWDRERDRFNTDIWLTTDARETTRLTTHTGRDEHPRWQTGSEGLAFLSDRGSEPGSTGMQIYLMNTRYGGDAVRLTSHGAPVQRFEWSPNGARIAFLAAVGPGEKSGGQRVGTKPPVVVDEDDRPHQLWLLDVASRQVTQLTTGQHHLTAFSWSPDSTSIVCAARPSSRQIDSPASEIFVVAAVAEGAPRDIGRALQVTSGNGTEGEPRFSPDGRWLSYLAKADGDPLTGPDRLHLVPWNAASNQRGTGETVILPAAAGAGFDGYIRTYKWLLDSQRIIFNAGLGVNEQIFSINLVDRKPLALTRSEGVNSGFSVTPDGMTIAFVHESPRIPSEVAFLTARIMIPIFLTELNPQSSSLLLGQVETIRWRAKDGAEVEGLLVYPSGYETGKRYPLVVYLHGGPEGAYTRGFNASWSAFPQVYAARGYAVFMPNFRGSSNYGAKFAQANAGRAGSVDVDDILAGIDRLVADGIADEGRMALAGWSYGGYLSAMLIGKTNRFRCAAYGAGLSNAVSYWGTADIIAQRERLHGGTPWQAAKIYEESSPLARLANVRTPTLIFHGEKDERVPLSQSQESYRRLRRLGVNVQMVVYPEQGHALETPSYQADKINRELAWIEKHLQPAGR